MVLLAEKQVKCQKAISDPLLPPQKQNISAISTLQIMNLRKNERRLLTIYWFPMTSYYVLLTSPQTKVHFLVEKVPPRTSLMAPKKLPSKRTRLFTSPGYLLWSFPWHFCWGTKKKTFLLGDLQNKSKKIKEKILKWSCQPTFGKSYKNTLCFSCFAVRNTADSNGVTSSDIIIKIPPQHNRPSGWCGHRGSWWRKTSPDSKFWSFCPENIGSLFFQEVPTILHDSGSLGVFTRHEEVDSNR